MNQRSLVIGDREKSYVNHMADYLHRKANSYFEIYAYTDMAKLKEFLADRPVDVLLISESAYEPEMNRENVGTVFVLNESGLLQWENVNNVDKYQSCENILKEIQNKDIENMEEAPRKLKKKENLQIIGLFSPIRRCLQTTFGLTMGQILARKHRTLYLNFEYFSGFSQMMCRDFPVDISDLLYYFAGSKDKLIYRLESMTEHIGGLDYIPPMIAGDTLTQVQGEQWLALLKEIAENSDYEYLILDLSDDIQGLFPILQMCHRIFTIVKEDHFAKAKIEHYEQQLQLAECKDVLKKTVRPGIPYIRELPVQIHQLTHGELAAYVTKLMEQEHLA